MTIFSKLGNDVFSPVDGAGNPRQVQNGDAQVWSTEVERVLGAFSAGGGVIFPDKATADANLAYGPNQMAWVLGDATAANNGIYRKTGASGSGSWVRLGDLPFSFIRATNAGAGTANAIVATTATPLPAADGGALIALNITTANTSTPVTVAFNGDSALTIKTISGGNPAVGGLAAGMVLAGYKAGSTFQLISDQASAAILAAAQAALDTIAADDRLFNFADVEVVSYSTVSPTQDAIRTMGYHEAGDGGGALYYRTTGSFPSPGVIQATDGALFKLAKTGRISVRQLGAKGDFDADTQLGTDDTPAFEEAMALAKELPDNSSSGFTGYPQILVPGGNYRLTAPYLLDGFGLSLIGNGPVSTRLTIDHGDGAGVRTYRSRQQLKCFAVNSSTARSAYAGSDKMMQIGILNQGATGAPSNGFMDFDDVTVNNQPGHGWVCVGSGLNITNVECSNNGGHGFAFDTGRLISSPDVRFQGWVRLMTARASGNGGHGVAIGHPDDTSGELMYRMEVVNLDASGNATDAAVRYALSNCFSNADQASWSHSGIGGDSAMAAITIAGAQTTFERNRVLEATRVAIVDQYNLITTDCYVGRCRVISPSPGALNPAVEITDNVTGQVEVDFPYTTNMSSAATSGKAATTRYANRRVYKGPIRATAYTAGATNITVADDTAVFVPIAGSFYGFAAVHGSANARRSIIAYIGTGSSPWNQKIDATSTSAVLTAGTIPTGTSGVDGNLSIAAVEGGIYIVNQTGSNGNYFVTLFGGPETGQLTI